MSNSIPILKYATINWYYVNFTGKSVILQIVSLTLAGGLTGAVVCRREVQPDEDAGGGALQGQPRGGALRHGRQHGLHHRRSCQGPVLLAYSPLYINKKSRFRTGVPMTRYFRASWIRIFSLALFCHQIVLFFKQ